SKNPVGGVDPARVAGWARRQGRVSLGHVSLHEQRKVARSCEAGVKALLSSFRFGRCFFPVLKSKATAEAGSRAFAPLRGASYFSLLVQREVTKRNTGRAAI